jgi:hypothetical protein
LAAVDIEESERFAASCPVATVLMLLLALLTRLQEAAEESKADIQAALAGADLVFVTVCNVIQQLAAVHYAETGTLTNSRVCTSIC